MIFGGSTAGSWRKARALIAAVTAVCVFADVSPARASQVADVQVKAAFLYNFAKFVQWPQSSQRPLVIGIVGDKRLAEVVAATVKGRTVADRQLEVRTLEISDAPTGCDVLYFGGDGNADQAAVLARVHGAVLTIGETPRFLRSGGMVRIFFEGQRLRFQINQRQADAAGLRLSSQALNLAVK